MSAAAPRRQPARHTTEPLQAAPPPGAELLGESLAETLRSLINQAGEATTTLSALVAEGRDIAQHAADHARGAAYTAGSDEIRRFLGHLSSEMTAALSQFDALVHRARQDVIRSIRPRTVNIDSRSGWITVQFDGDTPGENGRVPVQRQQGGGELM
jgi:hypothetical protein